MSSLKHIYISQPLSEGSSVVLEKSIARRLSRVLRLRTGARLAFFNGRDGLFEGELLGQDARSVFVHKKLSGVVQLPSLVLAVSLLKKDAMDRVLRQATELGVTEIYPLLTDHVVATKLNEDRARAILLEASEQCERLSLPVLHSVRHLKTFVQECSHNILWCYERGSGGWSSEVVENPSVLIGPEGGFSEDEVHYLQGFPNKVIKVGLGDTILRADTAVVSALSLARFF